MSKYIRVIPRKLSPAEVKNKEEQQKRYEKQLRKQRMPRPAYFRSKDVEA